MNNAILILCSIPSVPQYGQKELPKTQLYNMQCIIWNWNCNYRVLDTMLLVKCCNSFSESAHMFLLLLYSAVMKNYDYSIQEQWTLHLILW